MGLDGVELVMSIEATFGVEFSDAEAEACITPAHVIDLVSRKVRPAPDAGCVSQRKFHKLRKILVQQFGVARRAVKPQADMRILLAGRDARDIWPQLQAAAGASHWPGLDLPRPAMISEWTVAAVVGWLVGACLGAVAAMTAFLLALLALRSLDKPMRNQIPRRALSGIVHCTDPGDGCRWSRCEIAATIRSLVIEQLGIRPDRYREDAEFVRDLGME
jgi:acyl carrier protein